MVAGMAGIMEEDRWGIPVERRWAGMVESKVKAKVDRTHCTELIDLLREETPD